MDDTPQRPVSDGTAALNIAVEMAVQQHMDRMRRRVEEMCAVRPGLTFSQAWAALEALDTLRRSAAVWPAPEFTTDAAGRHAWRCNGGPGCDGWLGVGLFSGASARREYEEHVAAEHWGGTTCPATTDGFLTPWRCVLGRGHAGRWHETRRGQSWTDHNGEN